MADTFPSLAQRAPMLNLVKALGARDVALRRDDNGDWALKGARGHIYAIAGGFQILVMGWSSKGWNAAKRAMADFTKVTQDGDEEGSLVMERLPNEQEAALIRHWVKISKKRTLSEEELSRLRAFTFVSKSNG